MSNPISTDPKTSKCPDCHGEGEVYGGDSQTGGGPEPCARCASTGQIETASVQRRKTWLMPCAAAIELVEGELS